MEKEKKDVTSEIKELSKRISERKTMLASMLKPLSDAHKITERSRWIPLVI